MRRLAGVFLAFSFFAALSFPASAEEFYCEVMALEGTATLTNDSVSEKALQEGDLLKAEDVVQVGPDSYLDLAYDSEWNNVTRVEENSKIRIRSIVPGEVELESGGVFAKLQSLPKESTFSVTTPTAIASVRGTEYRTTFLEGETQIYNVSDSDVYVYGLDDGGKPQTTPVVVRRSEKTQVVKRGRPPVAPKPMEMHELQRAENFREGIQKRVDNNIAQGRMGKIQDVRALEKAHLQHPQSGRLQGMDRPDGGALVSREGEGSSGPRRSIPTTVSGDEARQATQRLTGSGEPEAKSAASPQTGPARHEGPAAEQGSSRLLQSGNFEPGPEGSSQRTANTQGAQPVRDFTDAELGPPPSEEQLKDAIRGIQGEDGRFDPDKVAQLRRKVDDAIESSSPEQKAMLQNMQRQVNETVQRVIREKSSGQPFGPDPGRRPQDGVQGQSGQNKAGAKAGAKPGPRPANQK